MALCDYRLCDVCGRKAFYDAHLNYDDRPSEYRSVDKPYRVAGAEQYEKPELNQKHGMRLDYVGDWAVICADCSDKYETKIVERTQQNSEVGNG